MALSKECKSINDDLNFARTRINMLDYVSHITRRIHTEEIYLFCKISEKKPISIESIHNIIGGCNADYQCMEVSDSFECYQVLRADLITNLQQKKEELLVFEDRMNTDSNIIICVVKIGNSS